MSLNFCLGLDGSGEVVRMLVAEGSGNTPKEEDNVERVDSGLVLFSPAEELLAVVDGTSEVTETEGASVTPG